MLEVFELFDKYLEDLGPTEDEYLAALRTSIKDVKVSNQQNQESVEKVYSTDGCLQISKELCACHGHILC